MTGILLPFKSARANDTQILTGSVFAGLAVLVAANIKTKRLQGYLDRRQILQDERISELLGYEACSAKSLIVTYLARSQLLPEEIFSLRQYDTPNTLLEDIFNIEVEGETPWHRRRMGLPMSFTGLGHLAFEVPTRWLAMSDYLGCLTFEVYEGLRWP
ncbi:hypothetical protein M434DRAFT_36600 [Hypoxylon sp. CO27-5]|nr:hypothetical protein M434DRAFT_36600 [Hypoxylon sp. CO27-5]